MTTTFDPDAVRVLLNTDIYRSVAWLLHTLSEAPDHRRSGADLVQSSLSRPVRIGYPRLRSTLREVTARGLVHTDGTSFWLPESTVADLPHIFARMVAPLPARSRPH